MTTDIFRLSYTQYRPFPLLSCLIIGFFTIMRHVWRYQIKGQTIQWPKEKQWPAKYCSKDQATPNLLNPGWTQLRCSGMVSNVQFHVWHPSCCSCYKPGHEWGRREQLVEREQLSFQSTRFHLRLSVVIVLFNL